MRSNIFIFTLLVLFVVGCESENKPQEQTAAELAPCPTAQPSSTIQHTCHCTQVNGVSVLHCPQPSPESTGAHSHALMGDPGATVVAHPETIPNFVYQSTFRSVKPGSWSDPTVWSAGRVPSATDRVIVATSPVTIDSTAAIAESIGVYPGGTLRLAADRNTKLLVGTLTVFEMGALEIGTAAIPVQSNVTAEIVYRDLPLKTGTVAAPGIDPKQYGNGLIMMGKMAVYGAPKTRTFVRLAREVRPGDTMLSLSAPATDWRVGDRLYLPDSKQIASKAAVAADEEVAISSVSADGMTITLASPAKFLHEGARNVRGALELLPHVANLSRNVNFRSENPLGVRGHTLLLHGADVKIQYAAFKDMGRTTTAAINSTTLDSTGKVVSIGTNQIGRYPMHLHHLMGPPNPTNTGYQFQITGNLVEGSRKWAIVVHSSHYGLIDKNIVYTINGAGFVTEDGNESYNIFAENFGGRVRGADSNFFKLGTSGDPFWFRGPNNYVRSNVAASSGAFGFTYFSQKAIRQQKIPLVRGADMNNPAQYKVANIDFNLPILEFSDNEAYHVADGMTIWDVGLAGDPRTSTLKGFRVWHHAFDGIHSYNANQLVIEDYYARGDVRTLVTTSPLKYQIPRGAGFNAVRQSANTVIRRADIQGLKTGIAIPGNFAGGVFRIEDSNISAHFNISAGLPLDLRKSSNRKLLISNVLNGTLPLTVNAYDGAAKSIRLGYSAMTSDVTYIKREDIIVTNHNRVPGASFRLFYLQQAPTFIVPQATSTLGGAPEAGLTNAQSWAKYGIAIGGQVAPCSTTNPEFDGFVCP